MSKDAIAGVYTQMLTEDGFRQSIAANPALLNDFDLTDEERRVLSDEAETEVEGFAVGAGPVMSHLGARRGPQLSPGTASALGAAINFASGLPLGSLQGPGFVNNTACCPWGGQGAIPSFGEL
jgi:hypothetical protein